LKTTVSTNFVLNSLRAALNSSFSALSLVASVSKALYFLAVSETNFFAIIVSFTLSAFGFG
jgi:hypothetical protein